MANLIKENNNHQHFERNAQNSKTVKSAKQMKKAQEKEIKIGIKINCKGEEEKDI